MRTFGAGEMLTGLGTGQPGSNGEAKIESCPWSAAGDQISIDHNRLIINKLSRSREMLLKSRITCSSLALKKAEASKGKARSRADGGNAGALIIAFFA